VLGLANNLYKGWLPNIEFLMGRIVPGAFNKLQEDMINGYKMLYGKDSLRPFGLEREEVKHRAGGSVPSAGVNNLS